MEMDARRRCGTPIGSSESAINARSQLTCRKLVATGIHWGLLLCSALTMTAAGWCQGTTVVTSTRMAVDPHHDMVGIPCRINGTKRWYVCLIDSGATYTVVSDRVVKAEGPMVQMTTGRGPVRVHQREVSLTIAEGLELKSKALVQSRMVEGVDILVGQDVLRQFKYVTFDYENQKVEFQR
jgi:hypothetical protein